MTPAFEIGDRVHSRTYPERTGEIAWVSERPDGVTGKHNYHVRMDNRSLNTRIDGTRSYMEGNLVLIEKARPKMPPEELAWSDYQDQLEEPVTDPRELFLAGFRAAQELKGARP